jgi:hypothetical protein
MNIRSKIAISGNFKVVDPVVETFKKNLSFPKVLVRYL